MGFIDKEKYEYLSSREFAVSAEDARLHAQLHLYSGVSARFRGFGGWERGRMAVRPNVIHDLSGLPLFYDFPVRRGRKYTGFIRISASKALGDPIVSTQITEPGWDMKVARDKLRKLLRSRYRNYSARRIRLVCYSYPKLALSAELVSRSKKTRTVLMDVGDFTEIAPEPGIERDNSGQIAYSLLNELSEERQKTGKKRWEEANRKAVEFLRKEERLDPSRIYELAPSDRLKVIDDVFLELELIKMYTERVLDFCCHSGGCRDHECFCLHPQENSVHCTRASAQMVFCYWRYCYSQHEIAEAFNAEDDEPTYWSEIVPGLDSLTHKCFDADRISSFSWSDCEDEIMNRRPFMIDTGGHTLACAGTKKWNIWIYGTPQPRYLYIFDPWPPNVGAVSWENFNTASYAWICTLVRKATDHS